MAAHSSNRKRVRSAIYHQIAYLPYAENLVKIGPVVLGIISLKGLFLKKLTQAEHSPRGRLAVWAK